MIEMGWTVAGIFSRLDRSSLIYEFFLGLRRLVVLKVHFCVDLGVPFGSR